MRGSKAKKLRRMAEAWTVGALALDYDEWSQPGYAEVNDLMRKVVPGVPVRLKPTCTRAVYQTHKRVL